MKKMIALVDSEHARLFDLARAGAERLSLARPDHHTRRKDRGDAASGPFYEEVAAHLRGADEVLVAGHGLAWKHFKAFLEAKHPEVAARVLEYVTVDHPTDAQVVALGARLLERAELFRAAR